MAVFRYAVRRERTAPFGVGLPDHFQRKLNDPGPRRQRLLQAPAAARGSVRIEDLGVTSAKKGQGRREVGVIQNIEKLRSELNLERL